MQYRVYSRQTLEYVDGGYVQSYTIDDDYIVNNNSTLSVVKNKEDTLKKVVVGDIIVLIQDSGAFHKGVITTVDDTANSISYKSDKELFNDNILNVFIKSFIEEEDIVKSFGIDVVVAVLKAWFADTTDEYKKLPIKFITDGDVLDDEGKPKMLWSWNNDSIKIVDWLVELFTNYNLSLSWVIDFNTALPLEQRKPQYICTLSAITNSGGIIKDNVAMQTITYTVQELPDATVCIVISSQDKEILNISSGTNLLDPKGGKSNKSIVYSNEGAISNSFIEVDNPDSNISGFIRIRADKQYTYSQASGDTKKRQIILYDKNKNKIGYMEYTPTASNYSKTFTVADFNIVGASGAESINNKRLTARYITICYCNTATQVQFEVGDVATTYDPFDIPSVFYLYVKDGEYSISTDKKLTDKDRVLPVRTVITSYNDNETDSEGIKPYSVAKDKLIPSQFNQAIQIRISSDSKMFDFANAKFGDLYKIINERGTIDSNYTGKKTSSENKWITLYFGLGRQHYTDLMQIKLRKDRYREVYNA